MEMALTFNEFIFTPVNHQNRLWIRSSELAKALGYSDDRKVGVLYTRHKDEFSNNMSVVLNLSTTDTPAMTRIFSLRGCHLVAMLARTPIAKAFRRWVLDVIEQYGDRVPTDASVTLNDTTSAPPETADRPSRRTDPERKALTAIINTWVGMAPIHYASARAQVNAHFGVASVDSLTIGQVREAIRYVQGKIDALAWVQGKIDEVNRRPLTGTPVLPAHAEPYRERIKALTELESRFSDFAKESRSRLYQFVKEFLSIKGSTYSELLNRACDRPNLTNDPLLGILQSNSYNAQTWVDAGLTEMSTAIRAARTANKLMLG